MQHRPPDKVPTADDSGARKGTGDTAAATTAAARVQLLDNHGNENRNDPRSSLSSISGPTSPVGAAAAAATTRQIMEDRHGHDSDNDHTFRNPVPANNAKGKQKQVHELEVTDLKAITSLTNKQRAFLVKGGFISTAEVLFTPIKPLSERLRLPENECRDLVKNIVNDRKKRWILNGSAGWSVGERVRASLGSKTIPEGQGAAGGDTHENGSCEAAPQLPLLWPGDAGLRELVGGGLVPGTLTELAGEASSGKTALSLQLALRVQLDPSAGGLSGSCVYLSSEGNFPSIRLRDMAFKLSDGTPEGIKTFMDNVHLVHCPEVDELLHAVRYSLPAVVHQLGVGARQQEKSTSSPSRKPVKLVIVDSIAAPFRGSEGGGGGGGTVREPKDGQANWEGGGGGSEGQLGMYSLAERNKQLAEIAAKLYRLAKQYSLVVVLCNQVSDVFHKDGDRDRWSFGQTYSQASNNSQGTHHNSTLKSRHDQANEADQVHLSVTHENGGVPLEYRNYKHASRFFSGEEADSRNSKVAVFGLSWANCINTRIMLSRTGRRRRKNDGAQVQALVTLDENGLEVEDPLFALETEEVRRATLIFSPFAEKGHVDYVLRQEGLVSVSQHRCTPRGPVAHNRRGRQRAGAKGTVQKRGRGVKALPLPGFDDVDGGEQEDQGDDDDGDNGDEEDALWAELSREDPNTVLDEATLSQL